MSVDNESSTRRRRISSGEHARLACWFWRLAKTNFVTGRRKQKFAIARTRSPARETPIRLSRRAGSALPENAIPLVASYFMNEKQIAELLEDSRLGCQPRYACRLSGRIED